MSDLCYIHKGIKIYSGETHFMKLPTNSYCVDVASRGSSELGSEYCNRGQTIFTVVPFCELVWPTTLQLGHCCS
jgi:hypothetical protein